MSWVKIDDQMFSHPKVLEAGNAAVGLWLRLLSWAAAHGTDGQIPAAVPGMFTKSTRRDLKSLTRAGLLDESPCGHGWVIHDYLDWNPSAAEVEEKREHISKVRSQAGKKGVANRYQPPNKPSNKNLTPSPSPSPSSSSSSSGDGDFRSLQTAIERETRRPYPNKWLKLGQDLAPYPAGEIDRAIETAQAEGKPNAGLVLRIIERWRNEGQATANARAGPRRREKRTYLDATRELIEDARNGKLGPV